MREEERGEEKPILLFLSKKWKEHSYKRREREREKDSKKKSGRRKGESNVNESWHALDLKSLTLISDDQSVIQQHISFPPF